MNAILKPLDSLSHGDNKDLLSNFGLHVILEQIIMTGSREMHCGNENSKLRNRWWDGICQDLE